MPYDVQFILDFLNELTLNNHKSWMDENRDRYQEARRMFIAIVTEIAEGLEEIDPSIAGVDVRKALFRINRDIRFSANKQPYKTNFGADLSPKGKKSPFAGYYIHLEPGQSMIGGGCYHPDAKVLAALRQEIDYNGAEFEKTILNNGFKKDFGVLWEQEKLKRPPKGYDAENPYLEYLKLKSFVAVKMLPDKEVLSKGFVSVALNSYKNLSPFVKYLNTPISDL